MGTLRLAQEIDMWEDIPREVFDDLMYEINKNDLECADNYRAYRFSDKKHYEEYRKAEERGCCGFFQSHTMVDGEKWIIGCNYGH